MTVAVHIIDMHLIIYQPVCFTEKYFKSRPNSCGHELAKGGKVEIIWASGLNSFID